MLSPRAWTFGWGSPLPLLDVETAGSPRFLGSLSRVCPALRPRPDLGALPYRRSSAALVYARTKAPADSSLSRLNHTASALPVYASQSGSPQTTQHSVRLLARLCRVGLSPTGINVRFRRDVTSWLPPCPGFPGAPHVRTARSRPTPRLKATLGGGISRRTLSRQRQILSEEGFRAGRSPTSDSAWCSPPATALGALGRLGGRSLGSAPTPLRRASALIHQALGLA